MMITTADKTTVTPSGVIIPDNNSAINPVQTVLAIGPGVSGIEVGDKVEVNPTSFPKKLVKLAKNDIGPDTYEHEIPLFEDDNGNTFLHLSDRNLFWKINEQVEVSK